MYIFENDCFYYQSNQTDCRNSPNLRVLGRFVRMHPDRYNLEIALIICSQSITNNVSYTMNSPNGSFLFIYLQNLWKFFCDVLPRHPARAASSFSLQLDRRLFRLPPTVLPALLFVVAAGGVGWSVDRLPFAAPPSEAHARRCSSTSSNTQQGSRTTTRGRSSSRMKRAWSGDVVYTL
jgi:hypothetical protein